MEYMWCAINMNNYLIYAHVCYFIAGSIWTCVSVELFCGAFINHCGSGCEVSQPSPSYQNIWQLIPHQGLLAPSSRPHEAVSNSRYSNFLSIFLDLRVKSCGKPVWEEKAGFLDTLSNRLLVYTICNTYDILLYDMKRITIHCLWIWWKKRIRL